MRGRFGTPSEKSLGSLVPLPVLPIDSRLTSAPPPKRMFCSKRNVWQGFGGIWRSLADAVSILPNGELRGRVVHPVRGAGLGGSSPTAAGLRMVPSRGSL